MSAVDTTAGQNFGVDVLGAALDYAARGLPVFPCNPLTKGPLVKAETDPATGEDIPKTGGFYKATTEPEQIVSWWRQWPTAMIGIPTGPRSGVWALDPDAPERPTDPDGRQELATLCVKHGKLPPTHTHLTPGGGKHILFRWDASRPVTNREGGIAKKGINVRGEGGYLIFPPSVAASGRSYEIEEALDFFNFAAAPDWLYELILAPREPSISERAAASVRRPAGRPLRPYVESALRGETDRVANAMPGERNNELNIAAFSLGTLIGAGELSEGEAIGALYDAATAAGLVHDDGARAVMATINSGLSSGIQKPRQIPERDHVNHNNPPRMSDTRSTSDEGAGGAGNGSRGEAHANANGSDQKPTLTATPYTRVDPRTIPMRDWLYGHLLVRGFVSATISPGGVGKSSLVAVEALAMAAAKPLLGVTPKQSCRVWLWNLEDPLEEIQRKIEAAALHYRLPPEDTDGRLFINSGRDTPLVIATTVREGVVILQPVVDNLVNEIVANEIDVIVIDPFVSSHEVGENDNTFQDRIVKEWGRVAQRGNCAIHLVDHTRKMSAGETEITVESSRGAKAKTDAARVVRVVNRMSSDEAERAGVENNRLYFRTYNDKGNLAPPAESSDWFKLVSVDLGNSPVGYGDSVGVVTPWEWPKALDGIASNSVDEIFKRIKAGKFRENAQAKDWVGYVVAEVLDLDLEKKSQKAKVIGMIKTWKACGSLVVVDGVDEKGKTRPFIEVSEIDQ